MTIVEFARRLRAREISAADMTEECLRRIAAENERLNAFILVMGDEARQQAAEADRELAAGRDRGALHGVPVSVKDLFDIQGVPTTAASRVREGHIAERDAGAIARLRSRGAVLIGKTNLHEFAFGVTNEDSAYGPARNPHDASRSPGGSSGGSAVSLASGMALASLGTDTGGSIRIPSAACGTVGLKPTYGEVSTDGLVPLSTTLDHAGPMATTVADVRLLYRALIGDTGSRSHAVVQASGLRLSLPRTYFCDVLHDDVRTQFESALKTLRSAGTRIDDSEIVHANSIAPIYSHISLADAAAYHVPGLDRAPERYTAPVRLRLEMGRYVLAEDYVRALAGREVLREEVETALSGYDALVLPTLPIPAPVIGEQSVSIGGRLEPVRALLLRLTQLFNLTGHPAISLPCGLTPDGLPCGLQLVGSRAHTEHLLSVAVAVERVLSSG